MPACCLDLQTVKTIGNHCKACNILAFSCACLVLTSNSLKYKGMHSWTADMKCLLGQARLVTAKCEAIWNHCMPLQYSAGRGSKVSDQFGYKAGKDLLKQLNVFLPVWKVVYLRAAAPAADPGQKKRFVCLRDDTKTKEFAQVRSSCAVTRRCLLLPFASDIFWCNPQSSQVRWMDACVGDILWSFAWDIAFAASKMFIHFKHQLSTRGMPGSVFIQCGSQDIRI